MTRSRQETKLTPLQKLLIEINLVLVRNGWRQYDSQYYMPITVQLEDGSIVDSHAWQEHGTIEEMARAPPLPRRPRDGGLSRPPAGQQHVRHQPGAQPLAGPHQREGHRQAGGAAPDSHGTHLGRPAPF